MNPQPMSFKHPDEKEERSKAGQLRTRYARFGNFEVDTLQEELTLDGVRQKLQGKVYQILLVLLGEPGDIVTREQVRRRLWPEDLHVNFDANVNTTINKLRQVLGDERGKPRYIETIPRRGYSFIARVEFSDQPRGRELPVAPASPAVALPPSLLAAAVSGSRLRFRVLTLVLGGVLLGSSLMLFWYARASRGRNTAPPGEVPAHVRAPGATPSPGQ